MSHHTTSRRGFNPRPRRGEKDDDFRWFYELADVPANTGKDLPIPVIQNPGPKGGLTPHTHTCLPALGECEDDAC
jgi:hypothetical protein